MPYLFLGGHQEAYLGGGEDFAGGQASEPGKGPVNPKAAERVHWMRSPEVRKMNRSIETTVAGFGGEGRGILCV
jgi:hypothetical protein